MRIPTNKPQTTHIYGQIAITFPLKIWYIQIPQLPTGGLPAARPTSKTSLSSQGSNSASSSFISSCGLTGWLFGLGKNPPGNDYISHQNGEKCKKSWILLSALIGWDMGTVPRRVSCIC